MRKQDHLLQLIATLTPNEKRYFKLFSSLQSGEKGYLELFEALENKTLYDAGELSRELGISTKQLADKKYYLSQVLLQNLRNLDGETNAVSNLHNSLIEARSLFLRGLYDYSLDYTEKILKQATALEVTYLIPEIIMQKQSCLRQLSRYDELKELDKAHEEAMRRHNELFEMMQLNFAITAAEQRQELTTETKRLFQHPLLKKKPGEIQGLRAFIIWFKLKSRQQTMFKGDDQEWVELVRDSIKHGEKRPEIYDVNPLGFLYMYTDLASAESKTRNYKEALSILQVLALKLNKPLKSVPPGGLEDAKYFTLYLTSIILRRLGRYGDAIELAKKLPASEYTGSDYNRLGFLLEYAINLFHTGQMAAAINKLDELLQMNTDMGGESWCNIRALMVLAQLDIGNYQLVPYLIKSARAWMKREKITSADVEILFSLAYYIARAPESERRKAWLKFKEAIDSGKVKPLSEDLGLDIWIERKLVR